MTNHFFQKKDSLKLYRFQFLKIHSLMTETIEKHIIQNNIFIIKILNLIITNLFSIIGNCQVVGNLFPEKIISNLLETHHFLKFISKQ